MRSLMIAAVACGFGCADKEARARVDDLEGRVATLERYATARLGDTNERIDKIEARIDVSKTREAAAMGWFCGPVSCARTERDCSFMQHKVAATRPDDASLKAPCAPSQVAYSADHASGYFATMEWCRKAVEVGESKTTCVEQR